MNDRVLSGNFHTYIYIYSFLLLHSQNSLRLRPSLIRPFLLSSASRLRRPPARRRRPSLPCLSSALSRASFPLTKTLPPLPSLSTDFSPSLADQRRRRPKLAGPSWPPPFSPPLTSSPSPISSSLPLCLHRLHTFSGEARVFPASSGGRRRGESSCMFLCFSSSYFPPMLVFLLFFFL